MKCCREVHPYGTIYNQSSTITTRGEKLIILNNYIILVTILGLSRKWVGSDYQNLP